MKLIAATVVSVGAAITFAWVGGVVIGVMVERRSIAEARAAFPEPVPLVLVPRESRISPGRFELVLQDERSSRTIICRGAGFWYDAVKPSATQFACTWQEPIPIGPPLIVTR